MECATKKFTKLMPSPQCLKWGNEKLAGCIIVLKVPPPTGKGCCSQSRRLLDNRVAREEEQSRRSYPSIGGEHRMLCHHDPPYKISSRHLNCRADSASTQYQLAQIWQISLEPTRLAVSIFSYSSGAAGWIGVAGSPSPSSGFPGVWHVP